MNQDRLPPLPESQWSAAQRETAEEIIKGPRGGLIEPFIPLIRSPELCTHAQRMGEYLRYRSAIGLRLSELAILVTARHWSQEVEWAIHAPIAIREGISDAIVHAIGQNQVPPFPKPMNNSCMTFRCNRSRPNVWTMTLGPRLWRCWVNRVPWT